MHKAKQKKVALFLAIIVLAGTMITGCNSKNQVQADLPPQMGGTFISWMQNDPESLDPIYCKDTNSYNVQQNIYDGLLAWDKSGKNIVPDLASSMPTVSANGLIYTFKLRKNVKFHNGDPFTADDVVYSFNRLGNKDSASPGEAYYSIIQGMDAAYQGKASTISGIKKLNNYTVQFTLRYPSRTFLDVVAMPYAYIVDKKYTSALARPSELSQQPVGTGPFKFVEWNKGQDIKLQRNSTYFLKDSHGNQLPYLDGITWNLGYDVSTAYSNFKNKQLDFSTIPAADFTSTMNNTQLKNDVVSLVQNSVWYLGANNQVKPFDNRKVRQALEYAIDKNSIIDLIDNRGAVANEILPPNMPGYQANPAGYTYNQAKAKRLLAEAGYSKGLPGEYSLIYEQRLDRNVIAANLQSQLANVGIKVKLQPVSKSQYFSTIRKGTETLMLGGWLQDYPDPDNILNQLFNSSQIPGNNNVQYRNPDVDKQLNALSKKVNLQQAIHGYNLVEKTIMQDAAVVPLYHERYYYLVQPWVHNAQLHPVYPYFYYLTMWIDQQSENTAKGS